jgi:hypothetical protein
LQDNASGHSYLIELKIGGEGALGDEFAVPLTEPDSYRLDPPAACALGSQFEIWSP